MATQETTYIAIVGPADRTLFPELGADVYSVCMEESKQVFVYAETLTRARHDKLIEENEQEWSEYHDQEESEDE